MGGYAAKALVGMKTTLSLVGGAAGGAAGGLLYSSSETVDVPIQGIAMEELTYR